MKYTIEYDASAWVPVPERFPTDEWADEAAWLNGLVSTFETDLGSLTADAQAAVREFGLGALTPRVPGTERRSAVLFTTTIPYLTGEDSENEQLIDEITLLSDTIISTFAWEQTRS